MPILDRTTAMLAMAAGALVALNALARMSGGVATREPVRPAVADADVAIQRIVEQYRASATAIPPPYDAVTLAGSGGRGGRDGSGLYAQFSDPIDISLSPDGRRLLVLDLGGPSVREIDVESGQVSTAFDAARLSRLSPGRSGSFSRVVAAAGGAFLLDGAAQRLVRLAPEGDKTLAPAPEAPTAISDLVFDAGRLFVLEGVSGRLFTLTPPEWRWQLVGQLPSGMYDTFCVDAGVIVAISKSTGDWARYDLARRQIADHMSGAPGVQQVVLDASHGRYLTIQPGLFGSVARATFPSGVSKPAGIWNIQGRPLGNPTAPYGYRGDWFVGPLRGALDPARNVLYFADRAGRRVTRMLDSFGGWKYAENPGNSRQFLSADYPAVKPAGTTRLLWISHSVFWDPAGVEEGNLALGAPRQLEVLLNDKARESGAWEVLNPGVTGTDFYVSAYPLVSRSLATYGFDYALLVMDIQNLYWLVRFSGFSVPAAYDAEGMPIGVNAELAGQPVLKRTYPAPMRPLADYIRTRMMTPSAPVPLVSESGEIVPFAFLRAWTTDPEFRTRLIDVYVHLVAGLSRACAKAGVKLVVLVAPTSNFISASDWFDAYSIGATDEPFERVHGPLLERFWMAGIPAYDLTYDMLAQHPRLFPFNAESHHRSDLFHRAVAESIVAVARRFNILSFSPLPARAPATLTAAATPPPTNVIVTERNNSCFVLRDLWDASQPRRAAPAFSELMHFALGDVERTIASRTHACSEYRITFVNVKSRDDYGNRDFRNIEPVASMRILASDLESLKAGAVADVQRAVEFKVDRR